MYRSLMGVMTVYCTKWPCERNCGLIHKHLMQRKKSSSDLIPPEKIDEVSKKKRNSSIDQGIFSTDNSFEEDASPRLEQKKEEEVTEERTAESSQSQPLATPNEQSKNISYLNFRSLYNPSNSIARANSPTLKRVSSDLDSILTDDDSYDYSRLDLTLKRPISSDDSSCDISRRLLDLHIHGSFEQGIHTLDE